MNTYFISDLHLDESTPKLTKLFEACLKHIEKDCDALYILGDFFELWLGDDLMSTYQQNILSLLSDFSKKIPVYFLPGNRDFLVGQQFAKIANVKLLSDPCLINLYGQDVILAHGDHLCTQDTLHQWFRKLSRNRKMIDFFNTLPTPWKIALANSIRKKSKMRGQKRALYLQDVAEKSVLELFKQFNASILLHGHTHRPGVHYYDQQSEIIADKEIYSNIIVEQKIFLSSETNQLKQRFVLPDWHGEQGGMLCWSEEGKISFIPLSSARGFLLGMDTTLEREEDRL